MATRIALALRIRAYVAIVAFRHLGMALVLLQDPTDFKTSSTYRYVFRILPLEAWAGALFVFGLFAVGGAVWPRDVGLRIVVVGSVFFSCMWAGAFIAGNVLAPANARAGLGAVLFVAFALNDLTVSGVPYVTGKQRHEP